MKITVINNGTTEIPLPSYTNAPAGATTVITERTVAELKGLVANYANGNTVIITGEIEALDIPPIRCNMKTPADATGGATTIAACGFDLEDEFGNAMPVESEMYLGAFDDAACTTPAVNATLDTAAQGTIDAGAGTNLLEVTASATGEVSVTMTDTEDEVVYLKAWPKTSVARPIDCSGYDTVEFTA